MDKRISIMMKFISIFFLVITISVSSIFAQSFEDALELYHEDQFEEAAAIFSQINDQRSHLFAGKSYLALAEFPSANLYFTQALSGSIESVRQEAQYSFALSLYETKNFSQSLTLLYELSESQNRTGLRNDARRFYNQILDYLSENQRFEVLLKLNSQTIQFDLVTRSRSFLDRDTYQLLVSELLKTTNNPEEIRQIESELLTTTGLNRIPNTFPSAPIGTVYNVGVILPEFDENDPDFTIPRNLYFGMVLAASDFNSMSIDQKVRLHFRNSAENPDTTAKAFKELVWSKRADAVMGPLFSEPATRMARLAEDYRIPMVAPLANSDDLNRDYNYTFQLNPTFEIHGKEMARYAVQELRLDTLAIITESGSLGKASALAFRHEAERLGAHISYYIEEDFESSGYDFTEVTGVFTPNEELIDSLNYKRSQAIYAPFTSEASTTMMNLMLNTLEGMRSDVIILGSEDWEFADLTNFQERFFEIYYTKSFGETDDQSALDYFEQDYETRFGIRPDRFSSLGYDAATYLFQGLERAGNPVYLERTLRNSPIQNGLSMKIHFNGNRINQHLFIQPLSDLAKMRFNNR